MNICVFSEFEGVDVQNLNLFRDTEFSINIFIKNCTDDKYFIIKEQISNLDFNNVETVIDYDGDLNHIFSKFYIEDEEIFLLRDGEKVTSQLIDFLQLSDMEVQSMSMDVIQLPTKILCNVGDIEELKSRGHQVNAMGWVDFPSLQPRIIKNKDYLEWIDGKLMYIRNSTSVQNEELSIIKKYS